MDAIPLIVGIMQHNYAMFNSPQKEGYPMNNKMKGQLALAMASPIEHVTTLISEANFSTKQAPLYFLNKDNQVTKASNR